MSYDENEMRDLISKVGLHILDKLFKDSEFQELVNQALDIEVEDKFTYGEIVRHQDFDDAIARIERYIELKMRVYDIGEDPWGSTYH